MIEKTRELIAAPTCSSETKAAAQKWLDAVGTDAEKEETEKYIAELEADIMPIDMLIGFAGSEKGSDYFGAETAAAIVAHAKGNQGSWSKILRLSRLLNRGRNLEKESRNFKIRISIKPPVCNLQMAAFSLCWNNWIKMYRSIAKEKSVNNFFMEEFRMATVLLIIIYIAFIGLGIPDSLFGNSMASNLYGI